MLWFLSFVTLRSCADGIFLYLHPGKFRHLPVVENGEVIALLDIAKCLYDAIARMERAAEKGKAIAAAVEGVEKNWGTSTTGLLIIECVTAVMFSIKTCCPFSYFYDHIPYIQHQYFFSPLSQAPILL